MFIVLYQLLSSCEKDFLTWCCSIAKSCPTLCDPWTAALQASLSFTVFWGLHKLMSIESVILSNHLILCYPLLLLPSVFPSIRIFPMRWLFASGGQSVRASASLSVLQTNIQDWSPLGWTVLISLQSRGLSRVFFNTTVQKHQFFGTQAYIFQGLKLCSISYQLYGLGSLPNSSVP